jgi:hypothetical protein
MRSTLLAAVLLFGCSTEDAASSPADSATAAETPEECFYATTCRTKCGGPITKSGCNVTCGPGEVEDMTCHGDAASEASAEAATDASTACTPSSWPTASTTGIPSGTPVLTVIADSQHTTKDGQVFDAVELRGRLYVDHKDVVIKRSRLVGDEYYAVYTTIADAHLTIEDSDIVGGVLLTDHFIGRRNHLHAPSGGTRDDGWIFSASDVLLEDNLIDGLIGDPGAHLDGIQIMGGSRIVLRHNWIEAKSPPISGGGVNAAIFFAPDKGDIADVTVECNMLIEKEGYYPLRIDSKAPIVVRKNRWQKGHLGAPVLITGDAVTTWEDNAYDDGEVIAKP